MKRTFSGIVLGGLLLTSILAHAQQKKETKVPMTADSWQYDAGDAEFTTDNSQPVLKLLRSKAIATVKNLDFSTGTISYDIKPIDSFFAGCAFRKQSKDESEYFYLRTENAGDPDASTAVQYAPIISSINLWDLLPEYQGAASFTRGWNHIKLVVSKKQMRVFVNDMNNPTLIIPRLEGNTTHGSIAFDGQALIRNVAIIQGPAENLSDEPEADITYNDPRYIRNWEVLKDFRYTGSTDFDKAWIPDNTAVWEKITAERKGMINLTRKYGGNFTRKITWLKTTITAEKDCIKNIRLGFSDDIYLYVNKQLVYLDKNTFFTPIMKVPRGRISIDNGSTIIPLKAGANEVLIGLAQNFYGWALIARLDDTEGVHLIR
ncbi:hypothetical protein [Chitinophaga sp. Cy-1792]|uniref:hypothetical protein n=1 Tax=Chitinophaga sp. Cy-1792 TaxID=2608339 RepID=UPI001422FF7D|nr:hypothetical protein [Chitinophaga sp. Cy-1792]NIG54758.1 hypothetical protein [Chitinophaga sp. Cy-1792]